MTLFDLFRAWCAFRGYFCDGITYNTNASELQPQCARLLRMNPDAHVTGYSEQTYILEARFGGSDIVFPFGQERRDIVKMESMLRAALKA